MTKGGVTSELAASQNVAPLRSGAATAMPEWVVIGGAGFIGSSVAALLPRHGASVTIVDRVPPRPDLLGAEVRSAEIDLLVDDCELPPGDVVLVVGSGNPRPRWPWTIPLEIVLTTARIAPQLAGRKVTLVSSVEIYGCARGKLHEEVEPSLPWSTDQLAEWREAAMAAAGLGPCPPWRMASLCRAFVERDPSGRWVYGAAKLVQESIVRSIVPAEQLTILRAANTFGIGQERVVMRLIRRALAGLEMRVTGSFRSFLAVDDLARLLLAGIGPGTFNVGGPPVWLPDLAAAVRRVCESNSQLVVREAHGADSSGLVDASRLAATGFCVQDVFAALPSLSRAAVLTPRLFSRELPVVLPPRPARPDVVADQQQYCMWRGQTKSGNQFTKALVRGVAERLDVDVDRVLLTASGTDALRLAILAAAGQAQPGDVAAMPSFTFPATAAAAAQLGYEIRFVDVDPESWTMDVRDLERLLAGGGVRVVVSVDTFGNPADYAGLRAVCRRYEVPLVADSAAALGASTDGAPVGNQAVAHAFSMSFAKALTSGGAGGAVVLRAGADLGHWSGAQLMSELHAVPALDQLAVLDDLLERRASVARIYADAISPFGWVCPQFVRQGDTHAFVHWVVRVPNGLREWVRESLRQLGIDTRDYFQALHRTGWRTDRELPTSSRLHREAVALPMSSELTVDDAERVAMGIHHVLDSCEETSWMTESASATLGA
jgi:dTDP-4-amino-4,6-dideoxygalactose transaminase/nucleoside-diphosphate-sugar epimerase